jgi:hypothetical protein
MTDDETATHTSDAGPASDDPERPDDADHERTDTGGREESASDRAAEGTDDMMAADEEPTSSGPDTSGRDVVVPMRVYKAVTVFTTLFSVFSVLTGFVFLDVATDRGRAALAEIDVVLALVGLGLIVAGAAAYAYSTRFRTDEMGKSKDDTDEGSDNG